MYALLGDAPAVARLAETRGCAGGPELADLNYPGFEPDKNYGSLPTDPEYQALMTEVKQRRGVFKKEFVAVP